MRTSPRFSPRLFLAGFCLLMSCSLSGLSGMHLLFACSNDTTNESVRAPRPRTLGWTPFALTPIPGTDARGCARRPRQLKRSSQFELTPFSHGLGHNMAKFFCGGQPPSYIDRRGWLEADDAAGAPYVV